MENRQSSCKRSLNKEFHSDLSELTDGTLSTEDGHSFNIHKIELVKNSKYFDRLFNGDIGKKGRREYVIPGIRGEVLDNILSYIAGQKDITEDNVCELIIAADYLLFDDLVMDITNIIMRDNLSVRNCFTLFLVAFRIQRQDMLAKCFRYTQTHFQSAVAVENSNLHQLPLEALKMILSDKNLCAEGETPVWLAIAKWIEADIPGRQYLLPDLLKCLAVSDVDEQLATRILEHEIVTYSPICEEMNAIKQCSSLQSNLETLMNYIRNQQSSSSVDSLSRRQPSHLYFILHQRSVRRGNAFTIYTTYDEKLDFWRKVVEAKMYPDYVFSIGPDIFVFVTQEKRQNRCYNLIERRWRRMPQFRVPRSFYAVVKLDGLIYAIGGTAGFAGQGSGVEVYDHVSRAWREVSPTMPATEYKAVTLERSIYVVGNSSYLLDYDSLDMIAQKYEVEEDSWIYIASPCIFRTYFALVAYRERLYIIGGSDEDGEYIKSVEVFDPEKQEWETHKQLPYEFYEPNAVVLNNVLVVYDYEQSHHYTRNPPLQWDIEQTNWTPFEGPMIDFMCDYYFFTQDDRVCLDFISRENKDPSTEFHRSPFSSCL